MGRKPRLQEEREHHEVRWYQWEFLRRNPEYQRDYESFIKKFAPWFRRKGFWYDRTVTYSAEDWKCFTQKIGPLARRISKKWQIVAPFPPRWTFDKRTGVHYYKPYRRARLGEKALQKLNRKGYELRLCKYLPTGYSPEEAESLWTFPNYKKGDLPKEAEREIRRIRKRSMTEEGRYRYPGIQFDMARSSRELLRQARNAIKVNKAKYTHFVDASKKASTTSPKRRRRLDMYDAYLEVWDLKQQRHSFRQIARRASEGQYYSLQTVKDHYKAARKLIRGGYKELR